MTIKQRNPDTIYMNPSQFDPEQYFSFVDVGTLQMWLTKAQQTGSVCLTMSQRSVNGSGDPYHRISASVPNMPKPQTAAQPAFAAPPVAAPVHVAPAPALPQEVAAPSHPYPQQYAAQPVPVNTPVAQPLAQPVQGDEVVF